MEPRYSTKTRAKRIEPEYFKRLHPFRRWRLILSITVPVVAAAWLVAYAARGDQRIYTSGPLSTGHAMFGTQCADCHGPGRAAAPGGTPTSAFFVRVSDRACLACHDAPVHHESQAFDPRCARCHVEHKGDVVLAALPDAQCSQCHADLTRMSRTPPTVAPRIRDFGSSHPEFAVAVKEQNVVRRVPLNRGAELKDLAQVKLNHQKHLKVGLKGLDELRTLKGPFRILEKAGGLQLACAFCHQPEASRASMQPISYIRHCGPGCHPLDVDARLPDVVAPHDTPEIVHAFLRTLFIEVFEQCQALAQPGPAGAGADKLKKQCQDLELVRAASASAARGGRPPSESAPEAPADRPRGGRLGRSVEAEPETTDRPRGGRLGRPADAEKETPSPRAPSPSALEWASAQLQGAERVMFKQKCEFCHTLSSAPDRLPRVAPTAIPARWLPHSVFDHGAHRPLACTECHKATASTDTTDVLLPSITVCRECHRQGGGARAGCVECHIYHDKAKERDPSGPFAVPQLTKGSRSAGSPPR